jgi:hypothetical protein
MILGGGDRDMVRLIARAFSVNVLQVSLIALFFEKFS